MEHMGQTGAVGSPAAFEADFGFADLSGSPAGAPLGSGGASTGGISTPLQPQTQHGGGSGGPMDGDSGAGLRTLGAFEADFEADFGGGGVGHDPGSTPSLPARPAAEDFGATSRAADAPPQNSGTGQDDRGGTAFRSDDASPHRHSDDDPGGTPSGSADIAGSGAAPVALPAAEELAAPAMPTVLSDDPGSTPALEPESVGPADFAGSSGGFAADFGGSPAESTSAGDFADFGATPQVEAAAPAAAEAAAPAVPAAAAEAATAGPPPEEPGGFATFPAAADSLDGDDGGFADLAAVLPEPATNGVASAAASSPTDSGGDGFASLTNSTSFASVPAASPHADVCAAGFADFAQPTGEAQDDGAFADFAEPAGEADTSQGFADFGDAGAVAGGAAGTDVVQSSPGDAADAFTADFGDSGGAVGGDSGGGFTADFGNPGDAGADAGGAANIVADSPSSTGGGFAADFGDSGGSAGSAAKADVADSSPSDAADAFAADFGESGGNSGDGFAADFGDAGGDAGSAAKADVADSSPSDAADAFTADFGD